MWGEASYGGVRVSGAVALGGAHLPNDGGSNGGYRSVYIKLDSSLTTLNSYPLVLYSSTQARFTGK
jgi:hypothetical protein